MKDSKGNLKIGNLRIKDIKNKSPHTTHHKRVGYFAVNTAVNLLKKYKGKKAIFKIGNKKVRGSSQKHNVILKSYDDKCHTCKCDICGVKAEYAVLHLSQPSKDKVHFFTLYRIDPKRNKEIMFNVDHVKPSSKGGDNTIANKVLTCQTCNSKKADKYNKYIHKLNRTIKTIKKYFTNLFK